MTNDKANTADTPDNDPRTDDPDAQAPADDARASEPAQEAAQSDEANSTGNDTPAPSISADAATRDDGSDAPTAEGESIPRSVKPDAPPSTEEPDDQEVAPDAEYEAQEWSLGDLRTGEIEVQGMKFKVEEPTSDQEVERLLKGKGGLAGNIREVVDTLVVSPVITDERWENGMTPKERALLAGEALDWFGIDDFLDQEALAEAAAAQEGQAGASAGSGGSGGPRGPDFQR